MTELAPILARLGLESYHDALVGEGFDSWETVLDIQESDLDALNVKLGHRRKLQREIANYRGISYEQSLYSPPTEGASEIGRLASSTSTPTEPVGRSGQGSSETKRKYRRHPRPDENAPDRSPSAYVIFSNKVREDLKGQNLSFAETAKLVGERWQKLDVAGREPFEAQAAAAKETYNEELAAYKKTDAYKEYQQYLSDFRVKHAGNTTEGKRPKIDHEYSGITSAMRGTEVSEAPTLVPGQGRMESTSSRGVISMQGVASPPSGATVVPAAALSAQAAGQSSVRLPPLTRAPMSPQTESPPMWHLLQEPRFQHPLSTHPSISEESSALRGDQSDLIPEASRLSMTSPRNTPPMLPSPSLIVPAGVTGPTRRPVQMRRPLQQQESTGSVSSGSTFSVSSSSGSGLPPITTPLEERSQSQLPEPQPPGYLDYARPVHPPIGYHHTLPPGPLPYTLTIPPENLSDTQENQRLRILPLPKPKSSSQGDRQFGRRSAPQPSSHTPGHDESGHTRGEEESGRDPAEGSEEDAVNTLAVMAFSGDSTDLKKGAGRHRPPP